MVDPVLPSASPAKALPAGRAAMGPGHIGLGPGFIDEDQPRGLDALLVAPPAGAAMSNVRPVLLGGAQALWDGPPLFRAGVSWLGNLR